jgi:LPXTG-motif cell wall-anchored protein
MSRARTRTATLNTCSDVTGRTSVMQGLLMWGLILPVLLIVAGIITLRRKKNRR